ncbi:MAG: aspartate-semialdehyde dehydrogenase [Alphaproteobacteria bacterium]|nr:aspartate-semialdehyde dehydrogenase [Alphaproteobacteria bacterium]
MGFKVAVAGATGNVGREILNILAEREFPVSEVVALASKQSVGKQISFGEKGVLTVQALEDYDFKGTDIGLFSPGASVSKIHAPRAAAAGCVVIDNTSQFRMDPEIPLVVPEVNGHALKNFRKTNIIANPNCSTIQMVVALKPLHDELKIKRVVVATYQSVSGAGKEGMDELYDQTKGIYVLDKKDPKKFSKQIAFNVIPHIDVFMDNGMTKEEWKMVVETQKILDPKIKVSASCVRVPVFVGHSEMVNVEFEKPFSLEDIYEILEEADGIVVEDRRENGGYATPVDIAGSDPVYISRIRIDDSAPNAMNMWVVSDNLRKGAALNAVQIAETLAAEYGLKPAKLAA